MENQTFQDLFNNRKTNSKLNHKDIFNYYRITYGKTKGLYKNEFSSILTDFFEAIADELFKPNYRIRLPYNTGELSLVKNRCKIIPNKNGESKIFYPINWKETNELWESDEDAKNKKILIRYTNEHSGGYIYKIKYVLPKRITSGMSLMRFFPCKNMKLKFANILLNDNGYLNCDIKETYKCIK